MVTPVTRANTAYKSAALTGGADDALADHGFPHAYVSNSKLVGAC